MRKRNEIIGKVFVLNKSLKTTVQNSVETSIKTLFRIIKSKIICSHIIIAFKHFYAGRRPSKRNELGALKENIFNVFQIIFYDIFHPKYPINLSIIIFIESIDNIESKSQMETDTKINNNFQ